MRQCRNSFKLEVVSKVQSLRLPDLEAISTSALDVIGSTTLDKAPMAPCNHEEADIRIFVHAKHASVNGMKKILIRTADTDVVVLAVAFLQKLDVEDLCVAFGVGRHLRYLSIHKIASSLNTEQCEGLPFFHALTGCDTVSFFSGKRKKTAFQAWNCYPEATEVFRTLSTPQAMLSHEQLRILERFVVLMYNRTTPIKMSTRHGSSCFRKVPEASRVSRQAKLHLNSKSRGQHIKRVKFGVKP